MSPIMSPVLADGDATDKATDDSDEDIAKAATVGKDNFFKRKQEVRTPESEFEKVTSRKDNKKKRQRNKSN